MSDSPSVDDASAPDADKTHVVPAPARPPFDLVHENAQRLLGGMLGSGPGNWEREGDVIGLYRLCGLLGEGGFGNVWHAEQTLVVKREVALKVIKPGMDSAQVLGRFNQERQALASLKHPNISMLLDAGVGPGGRPYFAMELVKGGPVTEWCKTTGASLQERLRLFIQICHAVQHAHEQGILHRDLKPTNILVTDMDGQPVPKVIDFGVAKALHASTLEELTLLTQADQIVGTPLYMSPEQIQGGLELDARSDVYALGVLLYELLTGSLPFDATSAGAQGVGGLRQVILDTIPERPSTRVRRNSTTATSKRIRSPRTKKGVAAPLSALPADLDWITMRALEKERRRRYATAAELAADVQRHLDSMPVLARPPSLTYVASRWIRRHRRSCLAASAVLLCTLAAAVVSTHLTQVSDVPFPDPLPQAEVAKRSITNSLGMKFVPVPGIEALVCIHETRRQDYAIFAATMPTLDTQWKAADTSPPDRSASLSDLPLPAAAQNHPVTSVTWDEAVAFCEWLSLREGRTYRLPTDAEWSAAVGLPEKRPPGTTPWTLSVHPEHDQYPGGSHLAPAAEDLDGNYADDAWKHAAPGRVSIPGYSDGFAKTAPVMSFKPNPFGLYDLSGNVHEWCHDWGDESKRRRVQRGSAFHTDTLLQLRSSERWLARPAERPDCVGFRCVLDQKAALPAASTKTAPPPVLSVAKFPAPLPAQAAEQSITNSLGMQFVPVPGTHVLFCIHETRRRDYAAFDAAVPGVDRFWKDMYQMGGTSSKTPPGPLDDHAVVGVSWEDAKRFCKWLTGVEGRTYRLPTDAEWSIAVGLKETRAAGITPKMLSDNPETVQYPWGPHFPPKTEDHAGNYADEAWAKAFPDRAALLGYSDGFITTAPVMSFKPNPFGLYDMGGNALEWCEDWSDETQRWRVSRSISFHCSESQMLRSSYRAIHQPSGHYNGNGFRCVLEVAPTKNEWPPPKEH